MLALPEIYVNGSANLVTTGLPMRIGVYALAKDEEKNVEQWLHHTADADFRIVVDTGSSDRTVDLLKAAGVDVIEETWTPFRFDEPRNLGLSRAVERGGHWFLCPDFDEWYSENWRHEIESIVSRRPTVTQIRVPICLHYDTHTEPGLSRDFKIHGLGGQWVQPIHEYLKFDKPLEVEADQIILNHRQDDRKPRKAFYFQLAKQHQELDPSNEWVSWFVFNEARIQSQDMGEIYEAARKYIELTRDRKSVV